MFYIPIILGTARKDRKSEKAANFVLDFVKSRKEIKTELIDVRDFGISATDNSQINPKSKEFGQKIARADALIIVSPEYNHGYPGELKLVLDQIYDQYARKPVGICGTSSGGLGGVRAVEQLRLVCIELCLIPIREAVYFSRIGNMFDEKGNMKSKLQVTYKEKLKSFFHELLWYAKVLKDGREKYEYK